MFKMVLILIIAFVSMNLLAQSDSILYDISTSGVLSTGDKSPFWIQSNRFGEIPYAPQSLLFELTVKKELSNAEKLFDYSFLLSGHLHLYDKKLNMELSQYYAGARLWKINAGVGAKHKIHGNQDAGLSGGGLLFSANSAPVPSVFIGIEEFTPFIFKNGLLKIKGGVLHGRFLDNVFVTDMLYHHKYAYIQLGSDKSPVHWQYGLDHVAQWGGFVPVYGQQLAGFSQFYNIFMARGGAVASGIDTEQINTAGNHIISQSTRLDVNFNDYKCGLYWQNINEDKPIRPIWDAVNIYDGLWGVVVRNSKFPIIKGVLYEYLNTTDQNGPIHDMDGIVYGGADGYFQNYMYKSGWTNFRRTIGTPFITSPVYNSDGSVIVSNNRVQVHHFGIEGEFKGYKFRIMNSYSKNYGTYEMPFSEMKNSVNLLFEVNKRFEYLRGIDVSIAFGMDAGSMYGNNSGLLIKFAKSGNLFQLK